MIKNIFLDMRLVFGIILAHVLLYFSFQDKTIFWYIFSGSLLILIVYAMFQGDADDEVSFINYIFIGVVSGLCLYAVFWLGYHAIDLLFKNDVNKLYKWFAPSLFWQYLALVFVAAPGEEFFWRGFIQRRLSKYFKPLVSILTASILYASVHIYAGSFQLVFAAFISGFVWGLLYFWKKSMPLVIVSHIIFDIMLFVILPLK